MTKRVTAQKVADMAGVSRTTVSFVLNNVPGMRIREETRRRVLCAAQALQYHPDANARHMVAGRTYTLGFIMRQSSDQVFADHFLPQVLQGLSQAAERKGYHILINLAPPESQGESVSKILQEHHVDGIVVSGPLVHDRELAQLHIQGAHIVLLGQIPNSNIPFIDIDNVRGAMQATRHLIKLGHQNIGFITNANLDYSAAADRMIGYRRALENHGIQFDKQLVRCGNFTPQSGAQAMEGLLALAARPTAVFVASDTVALGALQSIRTHGLRIPEDIAIVGFDDIPLAEFMEPPLTTIHLPANELGWGAADMLIKLINGTYLDHTPKVLLETEVVVRRSCGAQPQWPTISNG
ncbi:MAG: LacI family DNA-binding transcriptional regulator [Anaerolineaceae bacterium]|nr:LacI family DNA-binding transcriptional regulator [Anaerolineaceae bacterium]